MDNAAEPQMLLSATHAAGVCPMCDVMPEVFIQPAPAPPLLPRACVCSDPAIDFIARCEALEELVLAVCEAGGWVGGWLAARQLAFKAARLVHTVSWFTTDARCICDASVRPCVALTAGSGCAAATCVLPRCLHTFALA